MEDKQIIDLFWQRSENAIAAATEKYGPYCNKIAENILDSKEDAEECVNDTCLWGSLYCPDFYCTTYLKRPENWYNIFIMYIAKCLPGKERAIWLREECPTRK